MKSATPSIRRISLFGGPGCGKSTIATWLFSELKKKGFEVEFSPEVIKWWTFIDRNPVSFDQVYLYGSIMQQEDLILRRDSRCILVTDCPLLINNFYSRYLGCPGTEHMIALTKVFEEHYPSLNLYLDRGRMPYFAMGRFQPEGEAKKIDSQMRSFLLERFKAGEIEGIHSFNAVESGKILKYVLSRLTGDTQDEPTNKRQRCKRCG